MTWSRAADWALEGASVALIVVVAVGFGTFAGRRALVGELAEEYLRSRGVESAVEVYDIDARGFIGRVRLGPAADPDFAAERVEVLLASPPPPEGSYALRPRAILIRRPQLKARWTGERLSFGALDPLVEEFLSRPPDPTKPSPRVTVQDGALRLATPWGLVQASGGAVLDDSRLRRLDLALRPASLTGEGFAAELSGGTARVDIQGETGALRAELSLAGLRSERVSLKDAVVRLGGRAPYPDTTARRLDGPLQLTAAVTAASADMGGTLARGLDATTALQGIVEGPFARPAYRGRADVTARAAMLRTDAAELRSPRLAASLTELALTSGGGGLSGRGAVRATLRAERAAFGATIVQAASTTLDSAGLQFASNDDGVRASGPLRVGLVAARLDVGAASARTLRIAAASNAAELRTGEGGTRASGPLRATVQVGSAVLRGSAELSDLRGELTTNLRLLTGGTEPVRGRADVARLTLAAAPVAAAGAALRFDGRVGPNAFALDASLQGRGAVPAAAARQIAAGLPILSDEPSYAAAISRSLAGFGVDAPGLRLIRGKTGVRLAVTRPIRIRGADGAQAELIPVPSGFAAGGGGVTGGLRLAVRGGGLPAITTTVNRYRSRADGFEADLRLQASLDAAIARGAVLETRGRVSSRNGAVAFIAADCARFTARLIELGENDLESVSARICPEPGVALVHASGAGFRVRGRFEEASADAPFLKARVSAAAGAFDASGGAMGLTAVAARIATVEATDAAPERRFHPVALTGTAALDQNRWTAALDVFDAPGGLKLADADLVHDGLSGEGRVAITADDLRFTPDGLQPHDLSPLAVGLVSAADGAIDFEGAIRWTEAGGTSGGRLSTDGFSFEGPAGRVVGLKRELVLSSLDPITAPPGQTITVERIEAFSPLTDVTATLGLTAEAVQLEAATAAFSGGRLTLEPLTVPLGEKSTIAGVVRLDDVDLGALIERTGFADKVGLQAVVDGRVPFQTGPNGLRFAGGELRSVRPGRLSVSREALTGGVGGGGGGPEAPVAEGEAGPASDGPAQPAAPPNAFQDFAYQALENLAYDELAVSVDSRPNGRLGMIFTVNGRHDPPVAEQARIGLFDLLRGRAFERRIPLPEGAPVNLTLDSSINFDELLAAYLDLQRARSLDRSDPVQPPPATTVGR